MGSRANGNLVNWTTGELGNGETAKLDNWKPGKETGELGDWEIAKLENWKPGKPENLQNRKPGNKKTGNLGN